MGVNPGYANPGYVTSGLFGDCGSQGGHKVGEKNSTSFPGFSRAVNLLFHRLLQQKVNVIMTFIKGHYTSTPAM